MQCVGAPMLEKKDINELLRRMELAAQESDQAAQEARAQLARAEVLAKQAGGMAQTAEEVVLRSDPSWA